jgi:hypothetical protein
VTTRDRFEQNVDRATDLVAIFRSVDRLTSPAVDLSDLLRSALVHAVSALDHLVHQRVVELAIEIYNGQRAPTQSFNSLSIPLETALTHGGYVSSHAWFEEFLRDHLSWQSFQDPKRISEAIRLVSDVSLWEEVADITGSNPSDTVQRLRVIVDRRNKIAHEADLDPFGIRWPIDQANVADAVDYVGGLGVAIYQATE